MNNVSEFNNNKLKQHFVMVY